MKSTVTKFKTVAALSLTVGMLFAMPAQADYVFSGSGASGNLSPGAESWLFNADGGIAGNQGANNWGSPGVGRGVTPYSHAESAFGFDISFTGGGTILGGSITTGNAAACLGGTSGGTTFCTIGSINDIWIATATGPSSIAFRAQDANFFLAENQDYFVNVFFDGDTPTGFTGRWLTSFTPQIPEPPILALLGVSLLGLGLMRSRKQS